MVRAKMLNHNFTDLNGSSTSTQRDTSQNHSYGDLQRDQGSGPVRHSGTEKHEAMEILQSQGVSASRTADGMVVIAGGNMNRRGSSKILSKRLRNDLVKPSEVGHTIGMGDVWGMKQRTHRRSLGTVQSIHGVNIDPMPSESSTKRRSVIFNLKRINSKLAIMRELEIKAAKKAAAEEKRIKQKDFNFAIGDDDHVKLVRYEEKSLGCLGKQNRLRQLFVRLVVNVWFDRFILTVILLNALIFAITDYSNVDSKGNIKAEGSWENALNLNTNSLFVSIFTAEFACKVIAQGFIGNHGAYLTSYWNMLDFVVVVTGLAVLADSSLENISSLRMIRILRPLRSLSMMPSLKNIINSILASIPELSGVFSILGFLFLIFAIAGMELFGGPSLHARCRHTPYPVNRSYVPFVGMDYEAYRCLSGSTFNLETDDKSLTKDTSPWATPQECYWPLAYPDAPQLCTLDGSGSNECVHDDHRIAEGNWSWCGSNYDAKGNRRFVPYNGGDVLINYGNGFYGTNDNDMFNPDLNFGYSQFDNFGTAVLTIFQSITEEGWTKILYMLIDSVGPTLSVPYFILLILFGVFFVLQLLLAVLEDNFSKANEEAHKKLQQDAEEKAAKVQRIKALKNRGKRQEIYHVAIVEDSVVQSKIVKAHLERLSHQMDKEMHIDTFTSIPKFLNTYALPEILVQFDCLIVGQVQAPSEPMLGSDLLKQLSNYQAKYPKPRRLHRGEPIHPYKLALKIVMTADFERHEIICKEAGAHVVLDKVEDRDLRLMFKDIIVEDNGAFSWNQNNVSTAGIVLDGDYYEDSDEASLDFVSKKEAALIQHQTQLALAATVRRNFQVMCFNSQHNHGRQSHKQTFMTSLVEPPNPMPEEEHEEDTDNNSELDDGDNILQRSFLDRVPCVVCRNEVIGGCFMCPTCDSTVCSLCALTDWDNVFVVPGETVMTQWGKSVVKEVRRKTSEADSTAFYHGSRIDKEEGIRPISDFIECVVCEPLDWSMAGNQKPRLYLNPYNVKVASFKSGDIVNTPYGGQGVIVGIQKSLAGTHYLVRLSNWFLATGKSPDLYLERSAINLVHAYEDNDDPLYQAQISRMIKGLPAHDQEVPTSFQRFQVWLNEGWDTVRKAASSVADHVFGADDGASTKKGMRKFLHKRAKEAQKHYLNLVGQYREATEVAGDTVDDQIHIDDDDERGGHDDADLLKTKDPRSFVRLDELTLKDVIGVSCAVAFMSCVLSFISGFSRVKDSLSDMTRKASERSELDPENLTGFAKLKYRVVESCVRLVSWKHFNLMSGTLILINCLVLMSDHYPMKQNVEDGLNVTNAMLTILFLFEMVLLLIAKGPVHYTTDAMNSFDAFVVMASCIDLAIEPPAIWGSYGANLGGVSSVSSVISMLRCFRLFRIIKLALKVESLKLLFARIIKTFYDLNSFALLLGVFLFVYTVAGLQFFSNRFRFDEYHRVIEDIGSDAWINAASVSQYCFDNFSLSFASVFQILTTENWNDIMFDTWRVYGPAGVLFPCTLVLIGTFVLMNLFLGILLGNFTHEMQEDNSGNFTLSADPDGDTAIARTKNDYTPTSAYSSVRANSAEDLDTDINSSGHDSARPAAAIEMVERPGDMQPWKSMKEGATDEEMGPFTFSIDNADDNSSDTGSASDNSASTAPHSARSDDGLTSESKKVKGSGAEGTLRALNECFSAMNAMVYAAFMLVCGSCETPDSEVQQSQKVDEGEVEELVQVKDGGSLDALLSVSVEALPDDVVFPLPDVYSLGLFHRTNPLRVGCANILTHPWFETVIQSFIFLSSIALIFDNPLTDPESDVAQGVEYFQYFTTTLFTLELMIKVITFGFAFNKRAYLRSGWNILDFIIVIVSLIGVSTSDSSALGSATGAIKTIRVFRAFRPLRVINRAPGLRLIVNAVIESIPDVLNVVAVLIVCFSIFAVVSVNFLKGDLRHCTGDYFDNNIADDSAAMDLLESPRAFNAMSSAQQTLLGPSSSLYDYSGYSCSTGDNCCLVSRPDDGWENDVAPTSRMLCNCWGSSWEPVTFSVLDNYPIALMTLFIISTTEGWVDMMYASVDATGVDMQPITNYNLGYIYFYVLFILIGSFFALNLFVGVMMDNFGRAKKMCNGQVSYMTPEQQEWVKNYKIVKSLSPYLGKKAPKDKLGKWCFEVCQNEKFEITILMLILANTATLATGYFGITHQHETAQEILNTVFSGMFTIEMIMKLIAYRRMYFRSKWNLFDFVVTIGTDIGVIVFWVTQNGAATAIILVRIFRVLRVARLMEGLSYARRLIDTLVYTLPGIINITVLLVLLLFIYAVLGVQLFAKVAYNKSYDEHANFRTFENALLTLFRFTTGEGWGIYMFDTYEQVDGCVAEPEYDSSMCGFNDQVGCTPLNGCGKVAIFPFLLTFTIVVSMVLFNLFVGIIIEGFQKANDDEVGLTSEDYKTFVKHWSQWDDNGDLFITIECLEEFVATLPSPFGLKDIHPAHDEVIRYLSQLRMNVYCVGGESNWVHFKDVLISLATQALKTTLGGELDHLKSSIKLSDDSTYFKTLASGARVVTAYSKGQDSGSEVFTLKEFYAAVLVQHTFRHNLMAKRAERARREYLAKFHGSEIDSDNLLTEGGSQKEYEPSPTPVKVAGGARAGANANANAEAEAEAEAGKAHDEASSSLSPAVEDNNDEDKDNMAEGSTGPGWSPSLFHLFSSPVPKRIRGKKTFANGDVYEGELLDGVMDGKGTYKYHEGAVYIGQLKKGMREGYGKYQSVNGERYIGYFRRNKRHGEGTKFHLDGRVDHGEWLNGHFMGSIAEKK